MNDKFIKARKKAGFKTRKDAAHAMGVSPHTIKSWELGYRKVPGYAWSLIDFHLRYKKWGEKV